MFNEDNVQFLVQAEIIAPEELINEAQRLCFIVVLYGVNHFWHWMVCQ